MRVFITGATGFVGKHLSRYLLTLQKTEVFGLRRRSSDKKCVSGVHEICADILDKASLKKAIRTVGPDQIYHLAGQASVAASWKNPKETYRLNVEGTKNLLEAVLVKKNVPRVLIAGSAEVYGSQGNSIGRLSENVAPKPNNPYGISKVAQEVLAAHYFSDYGLPVIVTRAFNHIGPGQSERFVVSSFAKQTVLIERGLKKPQIEVGNLDVVRDFSDARDVVQAYHRVLKKGRPGQIYNVASGKARRVRDILQFYLKHASVRMEVCSKASRMRKADVRSLVGDARKISKHTGWRPKITFERSLGDILSDWREKLDD